MLFVRLTTLPVRAPDQALRDIWSGDIAGLGGHPLALVLRLDDGRLIEVAAASADRMRLVGPFLVAAIPGLPSVPRERGNLGR